MLTDNPLAANFKEKGNYFNKLFTPQCYLPANDSMLLLTIC